MGRQLAITKKENQLKLIGKNLADVVSEIQDCTRKHMFIIGHDDEAVNHVLDNDYDIDCFFGSDERLEHAIITKVEMNRFTNIFHFKYKFAEVV